LADTEGLKGLPFYIGRPFSFETKIAMNSLAAMVTRSIRLIMLLNSMSDRSFRTPPPNVGLKTVILAEKAALIEREGSLGLRPRCKLTREGKAYRKQHGFPTS
jgi:hypothetical protein